MECQIIIVINEQKKEIQIETMYKIKIQQIEKKLTQMKLTKRKEKSNKSKVKIALKILIIIILLACVVGAGIIAAMFFGVFGDDFEITKDELVVGSSNTIVLDKSGKEIANLSTDEKKKSNFFIRNAGLFTKSIYSN